MADWPELFSDGQLTATYGATIATDPTSNSSSANGLRGVAMTDPLIADTKGAWKALIDPVPFDSAGFFLCITYAATGQAYAIDLAYGPAPFGFPEGGVGTTSLPFTGSSIWNTPLGAGNEANWVDCQLSTHPPLNPNIHADEDIIHFSPASPSTPVWTNDVGWGGGGADPTTDVHARERTDPVVSGASAGFSVPWNNSFILPGGEFVGDTPNWGSAILLADNQTIRQFQPVTHGATTGSPPSSSPTNTVTYVSYGGAPNDNIVTGDGRLGAHGGSGMSSCGGCIRLGELHSANINSYIKHALKIDLDASNFQMSQTSGPGGGPGYRWPAVQSDTDTAGTVPALMYGSLVALKQSFNVAGLNNAAAKIIARTLQNYGAYVVDSTSNNGYAFCTEHGPAGRVAANKITGNPGTSNEFNLQWAIPFNTSNMASGWGQDINTIFNNLWVVNNNFNGSTGTIGGPGSRIVIPIGAGGDTRFVNDFGFFAGRNLAAGVSQYIPIGLKAGETVYARAAHTNTAGAIDVMAIPVSGDPSSSAGRMRAYGKTLTTTSVNISPYGGAENPSNLAGTKGPWVLLQTVAANGALTNPVQEDISQIIISYSTQQFTSENTQRWCVDIGIGPNSSSVTVIIPNLPIEANTTSSMYGKMYLGPVPCAIPAGTFIWARCAINISGVVTGATGVSLLVHGLSD